MGEPTLEHFFYFQYDAEEAAAKREREKITVIAEILGYFICQSPHDPVRENTFTLFYCSTDDSKTLWVGNFKKENIFKKLYILFMLKILYL